jgi:hypothetical protein
MPMTMLTGSNDSASPAVVVDSSATAAASVSTSEAADVANRRDDTHSYVFSGRASAGPGWGSLGIGMRVGVEGEYWLARSLGLGLDGSLLGQTTWSVLGPTTDATAFLLAPKLTLRSAPAGGYLFASLCGGYAIVERAWHPGLCINLAGGGCGTPTSTGLLGGFAATGSVGWLAHHRASGLEIGPLLRADVVGSADGSQPIDTLVTLNLAVGFAGRGRQSH